ncbi:MAG: ATPase [Opitutales bacterium]|nr:ATPase [Opitutales bacterium]
MALCVFLSAAELATTVGYSLDDSVFAIYARSISALCVLLFWLQEVIRIHLTRKPLFPYLFEHKFDFVLLLAMLLLPVAGSLMPFLDGGAINIEASLTFPEIAMHCIVLVFGLLRGIRFLQNISLSPGLIFILSFAVLISIGTILLLMPNATVGEEGLGFVDAAFFATSAVCVTGLVPVESMPETLSTTGQMILLVLCQLGGLGVMTITYFFAFFFDGGLSIRNRFAFGDLFNERNVSTIGVTLFTVVLFTAIVETLGAVAIYFSVAGTPAVDSPVYFSIFHSIMAFCNAGFSIVPDGLCNPEFVQNTAVLSAIGILTVFGALGFPVVRDLTLSAWTHLRRRMFPLVDQLPQKMMTHTRVVMVTTLIVSVAGTLILWLTEQGDFFSALFSAFASRTAGFAVTDTATLSNASLFVMMVLMLIGGAPFSTAGGIKVTTFAIAILALKQYLLGRRDLEIFGRRLDSDIANQALAIVLLTLGLFALVAIVVCALHPEIRAIEVMFESVSAVGTVGLSCGITAKLCWIAKLCLIFAMFIGRIGVLLFFASFISKRNVNNTARYPETTITL